MPRNAYAPSWKSAPNASPRPIRPAKEAEVKAQALFDVRGRIAFVTGAANGLGLAYAEALAENGALVTLADIDGAAAIKAATRLCEAGHAAEPLALDVGNTTALEGTIAALTNRHGRLDIVFANAGIRAGPGPGTGGT